MFFYTLLLLRMRHAGYIDSLCRCRLNNPYARVEICISKTRKLHNPVQSVTTIVYFATEYFLSEQTKGQLLPFYQNLPMPIDLNMSKIFQKYVLCIIYHVKRKHWQKVNYTHIGWTNAQLKYSTVKNLHKNIFLLYDNYRQSTGYRKVICLL